MAQHVFVAMPFGCKQGIDFDAVYAELIRPALEGAGFRVFRADEEARAGDIRADMFQELLVADLVVAELTLDNPNVWYELGVRHALRARGVLLLQSERSYQPFDIYTDRKLRYRLRDGQPDPAHLDADRSALAKMALATMQSWHGRRISPVFQLLPGLVEQPWRRLLLSDHNEFRDSFEQWQERMELARQGNRPGDVMLLADEAPIWPLKVEAERTAGRTLLRLQQFELALERFEAALALDPDEPALLRDKGITLGRLNRPDEANALADRLMRRWPDDPENACLRGRLAKQRWIERWRRPAATAADSRALAAQAWAELGRAMAAYRDAFISNPAHYYSGINALTLAVIATELGVALSTSENDGLEGGVAWACAAALLRSPDDFWARATAAELALLRDRPEAVEQAWRAALAVSNKDRFALESSRQQLTLLRDLGVREAGVTCALSLLDEAIAGLPAIRQARRVFLFSGHMVDAPDRPVPRFPADREALAAGAIDAKLDELGMNGDDLAICGGACGGDILFAEAALRRHCPVQLHLQYREADFLRASVAFAGPAWVDRYYALRDHQLVSVCIQTDRLGQAPADRNPYERNNLWQLYTALAQGASAVRFVALWNQGGGSGPGGTQHMVEQVCAHAGRAYIIDTRALFGLPE